VSRTWILLTTVVVSLLFVAFAACGGGEETTPGEQARQTPAQPAEVTPTQAAEPTSVSPQFSGNATASVTVGGQSFTFTNGKCDIAPDNTWLAVNIGPAGGGEYFGLLVGANPSASGGARPVTGGGVFTDGEIALTVEQGGSSFLMGGISAAAAADKVTLSADLKSGEFEGVTLQGEPISGSFEC
jgi:hypothetical protein